MARNTFLLNLSLIRRKDLGTIQSVNVLANRASLVLATRSSIEDGWWQDLYGAFTYRFFTNRSELEMRLGGIQTGAKNLFFFKDCSSWAARTNYFFLNKKFQKNISPSLGVFPFSPHPSTKILPLPGVFHKHQPFRRKPFSLRLISSGGKMDRMPMPVRWDWPWNAFNRSSHQKGWSIERYSRQQGILSMCGSSCEKPP